ncbi:MAG: hypothetical protein J0L66_13055 [Cytophagales bacterium]|nr:hypothetical protein [Cytophagales bacterium]
MIVSKPRTQILVSFSIFLVLTFTVLGLNAWVIMQGTSAWYNYAIALVLTALGAFVLYRIFIRYKIIQAGDNRLVVYFPVIRRAHSFTIKQVVAWHEQVVKTGKNSVFKELEIEFEGGYRTRIGQKEHTAYERLVQYLQRKAASKKSKPPGR